MRLTLSVQQDERKGRGTSARRCCTTFGSQRSIVVLVTVLFRAHLGPNESVKRDCWPSIDGSLHSIVPEALDCRRWYGVDHAEGEPFVDRTEDACEGTVSLMESGKCPDTFLRGECFANVIHLESKEGRAAERNMDTR